jgi:hypothetical protein
MANLPQIFDWFMTGKKPTQAQFWASWGSFWNKEETIPQSAISNLASTLSAKTENDQFNAHKVAATAHAALFDAKEDKTQKGVAGGYVPLDEFVKIANEYLTIVNDLVTGGATNLLSAEQGVVLKTQIDSINTLLTSNDVNLDTVQEIVNAIKTVETSLETILVNDLTTGGTTKALTAEMGKVLKGLIDGLVVPTATDTVRGIVKTDAPKADPVVYVKETVDELLKAKANYFLGIKPITGISYNVIMGATIEDGDILKQLVYDGTLAMNVIIPNNETVAFPIGTIFYTVATNTGVLSISGGAGVVFQTSVGLSGAQNEVRKYTKRGVNTWGIEGGVAAAAVASAFVSKTYFVNSITGNNTTGTYEDSSKPYATIDYIMALANFKTDSRIFLQNASTFYINGTIPTPAGFNLEFYSDVNATLSFVNNTTVGQINTAVANSSSELFFNLPKGSLNFTSNGSGAKNSSWFLFNAIQFKIIANNVTVGNNFRISWVGSINAKITNLYLTGDFFDRTHSSVKETVIEIDNISGTGDIALNANGFENILNFTFKNRNLNTSGSFTFGTFSGTFKAEIYYGNVTVSASLQSILANNTGSNINVYFINSSLSGKIKFGNGIIFSGRLNMTNNTSSYIFGGNSGECAMKELSLKIDSAGYLFGVQRYAVIKLINSHIEITHASARLFYGGSGGSDNYTADDAFMKIYGNSSITHVTDNVNLLDFAVITHTGMRIFIYGQFRTNALLQSNLTSEISTTNKTPNIY